ncbi:enoyl-[acyl-carrier-protein] reductase FabK [Anaerocolumna xylanovorans]|uniref:Probable nitronate monooxygenase n=1 Tax=Anaerocolumna xylanovorans DSM 12503 TaxID=1121345 RepID=A0A1M7YH73_9FIRM|nr:enoyl-[acyl-carrier-protein] reductase FabK [Anaerocolumna xylanovorans]SHO51868.1 enoyl-[acyl-carrier protein] reductase II [Anaerocolumna xylanovorans DSM 12503]
MERKIALYTEVCDLLHIKYPIIQGGMAWVAEHNLAAGVSEAGGLGIIAAGNATADIVRNEIRQVKEKTSNPFGVNIMLLSPHAEEIARLVIEEKVPVVTTGAGNPEKFLKDWKAAGITVIPVVASVALAKRMERSGADALVAEGCEAGGHIGELTTMALIPQIADAVSIPVIAAGGIGDGRGLAAILMLGAKGAQIGTRFVVSHESIVHDNYKKRIISSKDIDTTVTGRSTGHPVRSLRNNMTRNYLKLEEDGKSFEELELLTLGSLRKSVMEGDITDGSVMAGQIAGLIAKEQSCKEIIEEMVSEAITVMQKGWI